METCVTVNPRGLAKSAMASIKILFAEMFSFENRGRSIRLSLVEENLVYSFTKPVRNALPNGL